MNVTLSAQLLVTFLCAFFVVVVVVAAVVVVLGFNVVVVAMVCVRQCVDNFDN